MIVITVASALFISLYAYEEKAKESISIEEQRAQEKIVLVSLATENITGTEYLRAILVNNTGTITTRIRALYIDNNFIHDLTDTGLNLDDTYINAKDSLWIQIPNNIEYDPLSKIEISTERGIKSIEYEWKLKTGSEAEVPSETQRYNFGPLLLDFEKFYYTDNYNSNPISWKPGWSVEKGTTVAWKITVTNIDDRDLTINKYSGFTMVSNDGGVQKPWFIEPPGGSDTLFIGSNSTVELIYIWDRPRNTQGVTTQSVYNQNDRSKVFLTFFGIFHEHDGTTKPYGQTIPFEAVLVRDAQIVLSATPNVIAANSTMTSTITATIRDVMGLLAPNAQVLFSTTLGTLSSDRATTDSNGIATVTLSPGTTTGTAIITATFEASSKSTSVTIAPMILKLTATPSTLAINSPMTSTITALVTASGRSVPGEIVTFIITSGSGTLSSNTAVTNTQGYATVTFTPGASIGSTTITATLKSLTQTTTITISSGTFTTSATPTVLVAGSSTTSRVTAIIMIDGNPVSGETVTFSATPNLGTLSPLTATTNAQGQAFTTFASGANSGIVTITATWGTQTASAQITIASFSVTSNPSIIAAGSTMTSEITAIIVIGGSPVNGASVSFTTDRGTLSSQTVSTGPDGRAAVTLSPSTTTPGVATIIATWEGHSKTASVTFASASVSVTANPTTITANSTQTSQINATIILGGNPVGNAQVTFSTTIGSPLAYVSVTDINGVATFTLSPGSTAGVGQVTATWENITSQTDITVSPG